ncbi:MAG: hypothetical protein AB7F35_27590 [Acetobacteraceae bacterium]
MRARPCIAAILIGSISACGPSYSPDSYATSAVQQANKVEQGVIIGIREVSVTASGTVGGVTGAAAGGIAGAQVGAGPVSAFSALGGTLIGGLAGTAAEHIASDTKAYEYIVRKTSGDLVSVTQKDATPLTLHTKVLVIAGTQARVVPDYTVPGQAPASVEAKPAAVGGAAPPASAGTGPAQGMEAKPVAGETAPPPAAGPQPGAAPVQASPLTAPAGMPRDSGAPIPLVPPMEQTAQQPPGPVQTADPADAAKAAQPAGAPTPDTPR